MSSLRLLKSLLIILCLVVLAPSVVWAGSDDEWRPLDPADLALKAPVVEKDADAEALFWEVRIDDSSVEELSLRNYIRVKVNDCRRGQNKTLRRYFFKSVVRFGWAWR